MPPNPILSHISNILGSDLNDAAIKGDGKVNSNISIDIFDGILNKMG